MNGWTNQPVTHFKKAEHKGQGCHGRAIQYKKHKPKQLKMIYFYCYGIVSKFKSTWWQTKVLRGTVNESELKFYRMLFKDRSSYTVNSLGFSDLQFNYFFNELYWGNATPKICEKLFVGEVWRSGGCSLAHAELHLGKNFSWGSVPAS